MTQIFLDSGDPKETAESLKLLGSLDGQTTNPTYFIKSPQVQERLKTQGKFSREEIWESYHKIIKEIESLIPQGSISVEVFADKHTSAEDMLKQARELYAWTPNAYLKFPIIPEAMKAAAQAIKEGMRVNMTLCFNQEQAAAVYAMSRGASRGQVYISPFIGRHTDAGARGLDLIRNIIRMYQQGDGHVLVLSASLRSLDQFYAAIAAGTDIITAGFKYIKLWAEDGKKQPGPDFAYNPEGFRPIEYKEFDLNKDWTEFNIQDDMTDKGLDQFVQDWNNAIS